MSTQQYHYRAVIAYKGSNYFGWQDLGDGGEKPTVQYSITQVLRKICNFADCKVSAASRTDAGVHALGQVAKLSIVTDIPADKLQRGMNSLLPNDIRVMECAQCSEEFNPSRQSVSKVYRYYFSLNEIVTPVLSDIVAHIELADSTQANTELQLKNMQQACELFVGEHDFYSFAVNDKRVKTTVRTVLRLELLKADFGGIANDTYYFEIEGSGFLRQMVRYIVGALFELARGNVSSADIEAALNRRNEDKLSAKAKARGLQLVRINYEDQKSKKS